MRSDRILQLISDSRGHFSDGGWHEVLVHIHESLAEAYTYGLTRLGRFLTSASHGTRSGEVKSLIPEHDLPSIPVCGDPTLGLETQGLFFWSGRYTHKPDDPDIVEELARWSKEHEHVAEERERSWRSEQLATGRTGTTYVWGLTRSHAGGGWVVATIRANEIMMVDHQPDGSVEWSTFEAATSIHLQASSPEEIRQLTGLSYPEMFQALVKSIRTTHELLERRLRAVSSVAAEWELAARLYEALRAV